MNSLAQSAAQTPNVMLARIVSKPLRRGAEGDHAWRPTAALPVLVALASSPVATVKTEPAIVVTFPASLPARVRAEPPAEVSNVTAEPPTAEHKRRKYRTLDGTRKIMNTNK